jgi:hypothetical protein
LFVLTETVSLELETTPPEVGVRDTVTGEVVVIEIVEPTVALMVVLAELDAADAATGSITTARVVSPYPSCFTLIFNAF